MEERHHLNLNDQMIDSPLEFFIDPVKEERNKADRRFHLYVFQIPTLRVFAFASISLLVFLHNRYLLGIFSWKDYTTLLTVVFSYIVLSWIAVYYLFDVIDRVHLGVFFLTPSENLFLSEQILKMTL